MPSDVRDSLAIDEDRSPVAERLQKQFGITYCEGYGLTETAAPSHTGHAAMVFAVNEPEAKKAEAEE